MTLSTITRGLSTALPHWLFSQRIGLKAIVLGVGFLATTAYAGPREQALEIHNRVAGIPPTEDAFDYMVTRLSVNDSTRAQNVAEAVNKAMENEAFYSVVLKNMITPATNREQTVFAPLNDYTATVIGVVRDDVDFRGILSDDILYVGADGLGLPAYANNNNLHYAALETSGIELNDKTKFIRIAQSAKNPALAGATAGVMTSRAAAAAFFKAGTNRAMFRFTLMNHMCRDLEQVHDTTRIPDFIRQDVSRSPGGDSRVYLNGCMGCHSGMDPLAKAFAYYDYEFTPTDEDPDGLSSGSIHYNKVADPVTGSLVEAKYLQNSATFPYGYVTTDDSWQNYWRAGINANLGWGWGGNAPTSRSGASSMGQELANSRAFASCQVEKVFKQVCLRKPASEDDHKAITQFTDNFKSKGFKLKQVFTDTAGYCLAGIPLL
ncbi:MAG: hypothetical protein V4732_06445 [Pseudomonadota bacterium]